MDNMTDLAAEADMAFRLTFVKSPAIKCCAGDFITEDYDGETPYLSIDGGRFLLVPVERDSIAGQVPVTEWVVMVSEGGLTANGSLADPYIEQRDVPGGRFNGAVQMVASLWAQDQVGGYMNAAWEAKQLEQEA